MLQENEEVEELIKGEGFCVQVCFNFGHLHNSAYVVVTTFSKPQQRLGKKMAKLFKVNGYQL